MESNRDTTKCIAVFSAVPEFLVIYLSCSSGSQTDVLSYATVNGESQQVWHLPEAGANVPRSLADGRMDVVGHLGQLRAWTGCCCRRLAWPYRTARPSAVHDALRFCSMMPIYRHGHRYASRGLLYTSSYYIRVHDTVVVVHLLVDPVCCTLLC